MNTHCVLLSQAATVLLQVWAGIRLAQEVGIVHQVYTTGYLHYLESSQGQKYSWSTSPILKITE